MPVHPAEKRPVFDATPPEKPLEAVVQCQFANPHVGLVMTV